jgi:N-acetyl-1-D-myo-inositol-2-amino-2-deoxy-alpha-D-glucopyranoside deacetylase/mycothiol S-conjugate amidase
MTNSPPESERRTLLAVFAHPDDESFGPGGTLAKYAAEGVDVWLVCGTDGEAGTIDAEMLAKYASKSQLRAAELCCAAQALGLRGVDWLGYRDSGMPGTADNDHPNSLYQAPMEIVVAQIVAAIRSHRPQVVICDNSHGGYGHPDHIKLHQATVQAFHLAGDGSRFPEAGDPYQPQSLYFTAFSAGLFKWVVRLMPLLGRNPRKAGRNQDIDLVQITSWETPIHVRIDVGPYLDVKQQASACHASQGGGGAGPFRWVPAPLRKRWLREETFMQGFPEPQPAGKPRKDLFNGR